MKVFINPSRIFSELINGIKESDVTLNVGQSVAAKLNSAGFTTELKQLDSVEQIYKASNDWGSDLFVAIHCNAADPSAAGTVTFFCQGSVEGKKLAEAIQTNIISTLGTVDLGIRDDTHAAGGRLGVLRNTICPAVLVELAFISNAGDAQILRDRQEDFARAIAQGISNYCGVNANISAAPTAAPAAQSQEPPLSARLIIDFATVASLSRKHESNNDLEFLSTENNDTRYGLYGLSANKKTINDFVEWLSNHSDTAFANYGKSLADCGVNSEQFIDEWKNLTTVDPGNFGKLQDEFVKVNYFDKAVDALSKEYFNLNKHSDAMKAVVFARAVQDGVESCVNSVKNAGKVLNHPNLSYVDDKNFDKDIINAIYDELIKERTAETRLNDERNDALAMI